MESDATPTKPRIGRPPGNAKFPAAIPRTMTTTEQREGVDIVAEREGVGTGAAVRYLISLGIESYVEQNGMR